MDTEVGEGPYARASYIAQLQKTRTMVLTDLDGTLTSKGVNPSDVELADRAEVRRLLEQQGVVAGAVTARTCGLTLSHKAFVGSKELCAVEPPPHWHFDPHTKKYSHVDLAEVPHFKHCLDWDLTASFCSRIIVRNGSGYRVDKDFEVSLRYDYASDTVNPEPWRQAVTMFLGLNCSHLLAEHLSVLESRSNYDQGKANVAPLEFRFQFDFFGPEGLAAMQALKGIIKQKAEAGDQLARRIAMVDESRIEVLPTESRYTLYLVPRDGTKEKLVHRMYSQSLNAAGLSSTECRLYYAGDTLTDLKTGLYAGGKSVLHFLLPCGSRLAPYIIERRSHYGLEDLSRLWSAPRRGAYKQRLMPTNQKGVYYFDTSIPGFGANVIVIGDERYAGATPPGSVAEFLQEFL